MLHAALRGATAAMAMTGMRAFTVDLGIVEQSPPEAIFKQRARGLIRRVPRGRRRSAIELGIAPALGLTQARKLRLAERAALAADHMLYGLVLSQTRRMPRE